MNTPAIPPSFKDATEAFEQKMEGRLHVYVKEVHQGLPAVSCIWNESPERTLKDVVYVGDEHFDALGAVKAINRSMAASDRVVSMLIDLYKVGNNGQVGVEVEY